MKDDASVLEYPQDVHAGEAKIYSPGQGMKNNFIILQKDKERSNQSFQSNCNLHFDMRPFGFLYLYTHVKD